MGGSNVIGGIVLLAIGGTVMIQKNKFLFVISSVVWRVVAVDDWMCRYRGCCCIYGHNEGQCGGSFDRFVAWLSLLWLLLLNS